ncbi:MAG: bifunctional riboflavin kinase/FAD synthetase [Candidatus Omnitrophica bacterium]|nr:bifunctional riboflavin kinase/FAD synthetase [Candidatus Omnitrophota bacterium]
MRVFYKNLPKKRIECIAAIGVFDGIHLGHSYILNRVRILSKKHGFDSLIITFDVMPQHFLNLAHIDNKWLSRKTFSGYITDREQKIELIKAKGIKKLWFLRTNKKLLELSGRDFIRYICSYFDIKSLVVGDDFRFGYAGSCGIKELKKLSSVFDFKVFVAKKKRQKNEVISSTSIRKLIQLGRLDEVSHYLGRDFSVRGKVCKGKKFGRKIGFPTANFYIHDFVSPPPGVYAARALIAKKLYLAAVFIGHKHSSFESRNLIEAHILGFKKNILGKSIKIFFISKLRNKRKFSSLRKLRSAIEKDIQSLTSKYSISPA